MAQRNGSSMLACGTAFVLRHLKCPWKILSAKETKSDKCFQRCALYSAVFFSSLTRVDAEVDLSLAKRQNREVAAEGRAGGIC